MQLVLTDYLDIQNTAADTQQATTPFSEPSSDISSYFSRRKVQRYTPFCHIINCLHLHLECEFPNFSYNCRPKKIPLFKFEHSANALHGSMLEEHAGLKVRLSFKIPNHSLPFSESHFQAFLPVAF